MYYLPQEIEVWYVIPALRSWISRCLIEDFDASYEKVGNILGVSRAAISQYVKGKRAAKIKLPDELGPKIMATCKILVKDETKSVDEIEKLLHHIRSKQLPFKVCGKLKEGVLDDCSHVKFRDGNYHKVK
jgi:predicted transcriptional regulator